MLSRTAPSQLEISRNGHIASSSAVKSSVETSSADSPGEKLEDVRIVQYDPLIPPNQLSHSYPLSNEVKSLISHSRMEVQDILDGKDDRVLCIVGPCSIHDVAASLEYAKLLTAARSHYSSELCIVMRAYFEKPRTTVGWKGLIYDPFLDNSCRINHGLGLARKLLSDILLLGLPVGCELLDTISPQYIGDLITWGAIGARTTESQIHRQLASGVSFPVGFKNGTDGNVGIALDAIEAASHPHDFMGVTHQGLAAITRTTGNPFCHVILRGSSHGTNYDLESVMSVKEQLRLKEKREFVMIDCSHGNSSKDYRKQPEVCASICDSIRNGCDIGGIMIESNLVEGKQSLGDPSKLVYGQSITDGCVSWDSTVEMLNNLASAVKHKRRNSNK